MYYGLLITLHEPNDAGLTGRFLVRCPRRPKTEIPHYSFRKSLARIHWYEVIKIDKVWARFKIHHAGSAHCYLVNVLSVSSFGDLPHVRGSVVGVTLTIAPPPQHSWRKLPSNVTSWCILYKHRYRFWWESFRLVATCKKTDFQSQHVYCSIHRSILISAHDIIEICTYCVDIYTTVQTNTTSNKYATLQTNLISILYFIYIYMKS